jgi:hypothetical protein
MSTVSVLLLKRQRELLARETTQPVLTVVKKATGLVTVKGNYCFFFFLLFLSLNKEDTWERVKTKKEKRTKGHFCYFILFFYLQKREL